MPNYVLMSRTIEAEDFYSKLGGLEEKIEIKDKYELLDNPAANVVFNGTVRALYELLGYNRGEVLISPIIKYSIPKRPDPLKKRIKF